MKKTDTIIYSKKLLNIKQSLYEPKTVVWPVINITTKRP